MSDCCLLERTVLHVKQRNKKSRLSETTDQISYEKNKGSIHVGFNHKPVHITTNTFVVVYCRRHVAARLVEALGYKPEGRGFVSLRYH